MFDDYKNFMNDVANDVEVMCDDLLLSWLAPYGVTKDNYPEYIPRILVEEFEDVTSNANVQHWFMDGDYIFSVAKIWRWEQNDEFKWSCTMEYRQFQRDKEFDPEQED